MDDQKDRYGDKLHEVEKAREDQWAREQDRRLLEKMRTSRHPALNCPQCGVGLVARIGGGLPVMLCPDGHGGWVEAAVLERLIEPRK
jgi:TFIIB-like protein